MKTKVRNMQSRNGNKIQNQFIIDCDNKEIFQSYNSVIAVKDYNKGGQIFLDEYYWNYSRTTSKYRNMFLGESTKETEYKINSGVYKLTNLN
jgi:hypothetical protein